MEVNLLRFFYYIKQKRRAVDARQKTQCSNCRQTLLHMRKTKYAKESLHFYRDDKNAHFILRINI